MVNMNFRGSPQSSEAGSFWELLGIALLAPILLTGCGKKDASQAAAPPPPPEVSVITVVPEAVTVTTELPGRIDAVRVAEVRARATGILLKRLFEEGAEVKAGDVLFQIDPAPLQAILSSVKANLAKAEASAQQNRTKAERFKALVEINAVSKQDYDEARADLQQAEADVLAARAAVDMAELNLGYATVTAPISGRIGAALVTEGALVSQNEATPMAVIQQLDPIYIDITQSSTEVLRLKRALEQGQIKSISPGEAQVTLLLEDGSTYEHAGKLLFSDITVDESTGMIKMRAETPNPERLLLPGMFARARLEQAVNTQAITVPQRGITRNADGSGTAMVVTPDNKVESRRITTGAAVGNKWVVMEGLKAGDRVIVEGLQKVRPGTPVKAVPFNPEGQPAAHSVVSAQGS